MLVLLSFLPEGCSYGHSKQEQPLQPHPFLMCSSRGRSGRHENEKIPDK
jgi:hypothetical protein